MLIIVMIKYMFLKGKLKYLLAIVGLIFGAVIVHPYVMVVYLFTSPQENLSLLSLLKDTFSSKMLPMAIAFSFFSMVIGFLIGALFERNLRLQRLELEIEKGKEMTIALNKLISVLSHFVMNSTLAIKFAIKRLKKEIGEDTTIKNYLHDIEKETKINEKALKAVMDKSFLKELERPDTSIKKIIELTKTIEKKIGS